MKRTLFRLILIANQDLLNTTQIRVNRVAWLRIKGIWCALCMNKRRDRQLKTCLKAGRCASHAKATVNSAFTSTFRFCSSFRRITRELRIIVGYTSWLWITIRFLICFGYIPWPKFGRGVLLLPPLYLHRCWAWRWIKCELLPLCFRSKIYWVRWRSLGQLVFYDDIDWARAFSSLPKVKYFFQKRLAELSQLNGHLIVWFIRRRPWSGEHGHIWIWRPPILWCDLFQDFVLCE